jgi:hypothetical protein
MKTTQFFKNNSHKGGAGRTGLWAVLSLATGLGSFFPGHAVVPETPEGVPGWIAEKAPGLDEERRGMLETYLREHLPRFQEIERTSMGLEEGLALYDRMVRNTWENQEFITYMGDLQTQRPKAAHSFFEIVEAVEKKTLSESESYADLCLIASGSFVLEADYYSMAEAEALVNHTSSTSEVVVGWMKTLAGLSPQPMLPTPGHTAYEVQTRVNERRREAQERMRRTYKFLSDQRAEPQLKIAQDLGMKTVLPTLLSRIQYKEGVQELQGWNAEEHDRVSLWVKEEYGKIPKSKRAQDLFLKSFGDVFYRWITDAKEAFQDEWRRWSPDSFPIHVVAQESSARLPGELKRLYVEWMDFGFSVPTDEQALAKIAAAFPEGSLEREPWGTYWGAHGQKILDAEPDYQRKGAAVCLTDTLLRMTKMLCHLEGGMTESLRVVYFLNWNKHGKWIETKEKFKVFPEDLDMHIDFLRDHVDAMPDAFVAEALDPFLAMLWRLYTSESQKAKKDRPSSQSDNVLSKIFSTDDPEDIMIGV